ncbi:hypothetical protein [Avrilella dinanensis]|uniref:Uncharacterized protein n=1 Tax=Avrilella dinanensis TaxID=2008672 RepID=A0A2M9R3L8_9FLAO|nr:hypothetical protein [Avrilella dinanensis]PJR03466.1 hypothetical protein CDL10_02285 [Avrilella dinanensis]
MKKIVLSMGLLGVFFLVGCESEDKCHCEIFKKVYDNEGNYTIDYQGSRDGNCADIEDKDEVEFEYHNVSCD